MASVTGQPRKAFPAPSGRVPGPAFRSIRPGSAHVTLSCDRACISVGPAELAVLRSALDAARADQPERVEMLLHRLHTAEQGATIALAPEDVAMIRAFEDEHRGESLGALRLLLH
jgi:hypothetical protein